MHAAFGNDEFQCIQKRIAIAGTRAMSYDN